MLARILRAASRTLFTAAAWLNGQAITIDQKGRTADPALFQEP